MTSPLSDGSGKLPKKEKAPSVSQDEIQKRIDGIPPERKRKPIKNFKRNQGIVLPEPDDQIMED